MTTVLFFGRTADKLGRSREVTLSDGWTVADLRKHLIEIEPAADDVLHRPDTRCSIDKVIAPDTAPLHPDQEIAFFSVFSGG